MTGSFPPLRVSLSCIRTVQAQRFLYGAAFDSKYHGRSDDARSSDNLRSPRAVSASCRHRLRRSHYWPLPYRSSSIKVTPLVQPKPSCSGYSPPPPPPSPAPSTTYFSTSFCCVL